MYEVLGNLKNLGHQLPQVLDTLVTGLRASLDTHQVLEADGRDQAVSVGTV